MPAIGATYAVRLRSNAWLDEAAQVICSELPNVGGAVAFSEFPHPVKSREAERWVTLTSDCPSIQESGRGGCKSLTFSRFNY